MAEAERIPRVLVVDDEPNIRELVQVALKFHGCAVTTAANGADAIHASSDKGTAAAIQLVPNAGSHPVHGTKAICSSTTTSTCGSAGAARTGSGSPSPAPA